MYLLALLQIGQNNHFTLTPRTSFFNPGILRMLSIRVNVYSNILDVCLLGARQHPHNCPIPAKTLTCLLHEHTLNILIKNDERLFSEVNIEIKGNDEAVLDSYSKFIAKAAQCLDINTNQ